MMKKAEMLLEKWGPYALALLCAAVILLSALWTRREEANPPGGAAVLSDESQRMADVTASPAPPVLARPANGGVITGFSEKPVFFPASGVWMVHPALDFAAAAGDKIFAMGEGIVSAIQEDGVALTLENGLTCLYRGLSEIFVQAGQQVRAGECMGLAGGNVPLEGEGRVCVAVLSDEGKIDFEKWLDTGDE